MSNIPSWDPTSLRPYVAFYKGKQYELTANSAYNAQVIAAKHFKAKRHYEVTVVLADVTHSTSGL
jgi:hypothetical protein